jgi:serine phosphatase RsbU (regulator of sigma subunit)/pSer/pThr/pTyr-binding forkhead associated (FHA) protein
MVRIGEEFPCDRASPFPTKHGMDAAVLRILEGPGAGQVHPLADQEVLIGRDPGCAVVLDHKSTSRRHARIVREHDRWLIEDLRSTNHTFVNDMPTSGRVALNDQDRIRVGQSTILFQTAASESSVPNERMTLVDRIGALRPLHTIVDLKPEAKLQAILEITEVLGHSLDLDELLPKIVVGLTTIFPRADRAIALLREGGVLVPKAVKHRQDDLANFEYSRTLVEHAMTEREAILCKDVLSDQRLAAAVSLVSSGVRSVMCVPLLLQNGDAVGVIQLDTQSEHAPFTSEDMRILASMASQVSMAIEYCEQHKERVIQTRLREEMDFAKQVQRSLMPHSEPAIEGYEFWSYYLAAHKVGGDFFDYLALPNGKEAVILGDVSGKGVPAALVMAKISTVCKIELLSCQDDPGKALDSINHGLDSEPHFVTLVLCMIDPRTHEITTGSAGHMSPMVCRRDGTIDEPVDGALRGVALGILDDFHYEMVTTALAPGECIVLYSDGVSEAMDAEDRTYSSQRLARLLSTLAGHGVEEVGNTVLRDVARHRGNSDQSDDITLVVFRRLP